MECTFCNNSFNNKHTLYKHQQTAKYCLKIRNKNIVSKHKCEGCHKTFTIIYDLNIHRKICRANTIIEEYKLQLLNVTNNCNELKIELKNNEKQFVQYEKIMEDQKQTIKELQDKLENIAIKAVQRPTTTNKTNNINNYIQNMQPLTPNHLLEQSTNLTLEHIQKGASGYAEYALEYPLKERVACVDYSRRKLKFKDREGNLVSDPEMVKLAPMFFESIQAKSSEIVFDQNKSDMDSAMFERVAKLFNTNADVKNGADGVKSDFYHDFIRHVCSGSVVE